MGDYQNRINGAVNKLKQMTNKTIHSSMNYYNKYKKVGASLCLVALLSASISNDPVQATEEHKLSIQTIYHVYIDDERVGAIDDKSLIDNLVNNKINDYSDNFEDVNLVVAQDIKLIPEIVFVSRADNSGTLSLLREKLTVKAEAVALNIKGEAVAYVGSEAEFDEIINKLKLKYVSEEQLLAIEAGKTKSEPSVGETIILDVRLSEEIEKQATHVNPDKILTVDEAIKQLTLGVLEDDIYSVKPGDVLGTIAQAHGLTIADLKALNPSITENTLLQIGDKINVTVYQPFVKVIIDEATKLKEEIPFQTITKEDANMWRGDTKVQQTGQKGERVVSYSITRENGRAIQRKIVSENITKEPVDHIVLKGTKVTPSRGTGQLGWPAVGGYISSYQGMRWGRFHAGIDIARPSNFNILAADNGTVSFAGWSGGFGNKVVINHNNGMSTLYAHLSSIDVRVGQVVAKGSKIGVMGSTGNSTGTHLHFEVHQNGQVKNPMDYLRK